MDQAKYKEYLKEKYFKEGLSFRDIAKALNTYPNKVRKEFLAFGFTPRDKSEAQQLCLEQGKQSHPTKGKKRSDDEKQRISENLAKNWSKMPDDERARRSKISKDEWDSKSLEEQQNFRHKAAVAMRKSADEGSKMEKIVASYLLELGYPNVFHQELRLQNKELEVDIYVPSLNLAIEIDGPTHFLPIWGEEKLAKRINSDNEKNGQLITGGTSVARLKHIVKKISKKYERDVKAKLKEMIKTFEANKMKPQVYLMEI